MLLLCGQVCILFILYNPKLENSDNGGLEDDMRAFDRYFTGCSFQGGTYDDSESPNKKFNAKDYHSGYGTSVIGNK